MDHLVFGTILSFGASTFLIISVALLMELPKALAVHGDKKRTLKRLKKQISAADNKIPAPVKGINDGVHCAYCGSVYSEDMAKCPSCGAAVFKPTDLTTIQASAEIRRAILERDSLLLLESRTQTEFFEAQEIKHNKLLRFGIIAAILYTFIAIICILEWAGIMH